MPFAHGDAQFNSWGEITMKERDNLRKRVDELISNSVLNSLLWVERFLTRQNNRSHRKRQLCSDFWRFFREKTYVWLYFLFLTKYIKWSEMQSQAPTTTFSSSSHGFLHLSRFYTSKIISRVPSFSLPRYDPYFGISIISVLTLRVQWFHAIPWLPGT